MSFTSEIKKEICKEEIDAQMIKAQLCALFQMRASLHMNWQGMYLSFQTENATIAKHVFQIMKTLYDVDPRLSVLKKMQLKKNNIYRIQVFDKAQEILEDLQILTDSGLRYTPSVKIGSVLKRWLELICKGVFWLVAVSTHQNRVIII